VPRRRPTIQIVLDSVGLKGAPPVFPSTGVPFGRAPDAVQRLEMKRVESDADFLSRVRLDRDHAHAFTQLSLCFGRSTIPLRLDLTTGC